MVIALNGVDFVRTQQTYKCGDASTQHHATPHDTTSTFHVPAHLAHTHAKRPHFYSHSGN